jgi:methionyl-tRNA synthetase
MWQAMLMAAQLPNSKQIIINGFFTGEGGIKMSKSIGNVVNPYDVVAEYGTDALRYYVTREVSMFEDSPFYMEAFQRCAIMRTWQMESETSFSNHEYGGDLRCRYFKYYLPRIF